MNAQTRAAPPLVGEEIEWDIIIRMPNGRYRLPCHKEFIKIIELFRDKLKYPLPDTYYGMTENIDKETQAKIKAHFLLHDAGFLPSGFRLYVDGSHLETSTPECANIHDLIVSSRVSEMMLNTIRIIFEDYLNEKHKGHRVKIFKDTTDRQNATYAGHENYLIHQRTFRQLTKKITNKTLQFASFVGPWRTPLIGAGKKGSQNWLPSTYFQISQRADWIERIIGEVTTVQRSLVNTRDEPHAVYTMINGKREPVSRLHHICGEPNMSPASIRMRFGYTSLFLRGLQDDIFDAIQKDIIAADPVKAMHIVSRDILCQRTIELFSGKKVKFYDVLRTINDRLRWYFQELREPTQEQLEILEEAEYYCDSFAKGPKLYLEELTELGWIHRFQVYNSVEGDMEKQYVDLAFADIDPNESGYYQDMETLKDLKIIKGRDLVDEQEVSHRLDSPPTGSRALLRGMILKKFPDLRCDWEMIRLSPENILFLYDPHQNGCDKAVQIVETATNKEDLTKKLITERFDVRRLKEVRYERTGN